VWAAAQALSTADSIPPPDPDDEYRVEWRDAGGVCVMKRRDLVRQKVPLSRAVFKSWLRLAAEEHHITVQTTSLPVQPFTGLIASVAILRHLKCLESRRWGPSTHHSEIGWVFINPKP